MEAARVGNRGVVEQCFELVVRGIWINPARELHGAGESRSVRNSGYGKFGFQKSAVKACVVRYQGIITNKITEAGHDLPAWRSTADHGIGNAGEQLNLRWEGNASVHQAVEGIDDALIAYLDRRYLRGAGTSVRGEAGGLDVNDDYCFRHD